MLETKNNSILPSFYNDHTKALPPGTEEIIPQWWQTTTGKAQMEEEVTQRHRITVISRHVHRAQSFGRTVYGLSCRHVWLQLISLSRGVHGKILPEYRIFGKAGFCPLNRRHLGNRMKTLLEALPMTSTTSKVMYMPYWWYTLFPLTRRQWV
jgi:hypothetical protein